MKARHINSWGSCSMSPIRPFDEAQASFPEVDELFSLPMFLEDWGRKLEAHPIGCCKWACLKLASLPYCGSCFIERTFNKSSCCSLDQLPPQQEPHPLLGPSFAPWWLIAGRLYRVTLANNYDNVQHRQHRQCAILLVLGRTLCVLHGLCQSSKE